MRSSTSTWMHPSTPARLLAAALLTGGVLAPTYGDDFQWECETPEVVPPPEFPSLPDGMKSCEFPIPLGNPPGGTEPPIVSTNIPSSASFFDIVQVMYPVHGSNLQPPEPHSAVHLARYRLASGLPSGPSPLLFDMHLVESHGEWRLYFQLADPSTPWTQSLFLSQELGASTPTDRSMPHADVLLQFTAEQADSNQDEGIQIDIFVYLPARSSLTTATVHLPGSRVVNMRKIGVLDQSAAPVSTSWISALRIHQ